MDNKAAAKAFSEYLSILKQTLQIAGAWHERVERGEIPSPLETEAYLSDMDVYQSRAKIAWDEYLKLKPGYKLS